MKNILKKQTPTILEAGDRNTVTKKKNSFQESNRKNKINRALYRVWWCGSPLRSFSVIDLSASMYLTVLMWFAGSWLCTPLVQPSLVTCLGPRQNYYQVLGSAVKKKTIKWIPRVEVEMLKKNPSKSIPHFRVVLSKKTRHGGLSMLYIINNLYS